MTKARELAKLGEVLTNSQIGGRRNLIINGAMQVAQRGTSATGVGDTNGVYPTVDRFIFEAGNTSGRLTMTQETISDLSGFTKAIKLACTTADTSISANEFLMLGQRFEGQDLQQLKKGTSDAEKITVSFYVKGNANATYTLELRDNDNSRSNSQEFSVTTSWNRVSMTFDGDTSGALDNDNGLSLKCNIWLHGGSTYTGGTHTSNTWHGTTNQRVGDNQTSFFDSTDRTFFVTGWQVELGSVATPFESRSFGEELILCKRYTEVFRWDDTTNALMVFGYWTSTTTSEHVLYSQVEMRTVPSFSFSNATDFDVLEPQTAFRDTTAISTNERSRFSTKFTATSGSTAGFGDGRRSALLRADTTNAFMMFDAEL
jgi:hypothetical protein